MGITLQNNAVGYLSTAIDAVDTGIALDAGDGDNFPALGVGDYFYATLVSTAGVKEIVKVTALSGDSMTVTRAQEGTTAQAFAAGTALELRVTVQNLEDQAAAALSTVLATANTWTAIQTFEARVEFDNGTAVRFYDSTDTNYHSFENATNVLTMGYNGTAWGTVSAAGIFDFVQSPTIASAYIYRAGGTDIPVTDGGTGASTAADARTNLGLVIGTDVAAYDAGLASIAGLATGTDKMIYTTALDSYAVADLTSFARTLLDDASASAARTTLGLGTIATQAASSVAITGGTISGVEDLQAQVKTSSETSGVLTALSRNTQVEATGNITINTGVFYGGDIILFYSGASSRTVTQGTSFTLRLGNSETTGNRTVAARCLAPIKFIGDPDTTSTEAVIVGAGVS